MTDSHLTNRNFWIQYWKNFVPVPSEKTLFFSDLLGTFPKAGSRLIEIGGFPGGFCAYFKKFHHYDVTLLDFIVIPEHIRSIERINDLPLGSIQSIEADFFKYVPQSEYDVVFSAGFIEHFEDTAQVISQHLKHLKKGGTLFISLPNFRGINGFIQKQFDSKNYKAHNVKIMDIVLLSRICDDLGLKETTIRYHGTPCLWLDHPEKLNPVIRKMIYLLSFVIGKLPFRGKWFSPHIVIIAKTSTQL